MNIKALAQQTMSRNGWSQAQLAREVGIHPVTLSKLLSESAGRNSSFEKLCAYLLQDTPNNQALTPGSPDIADSRLEHAPGHGQ